MARASERMHIRQLGVTERAEETIVISTTTDLGTLSGLSENLAVRGKDVPFGIQTATIPDSMSRGPRLAWRPSREECRA